MRTPGSFQRVLIQARRRQRLGRLADALWTAAIVLLVGGIILAFVRVWGWLTSDPSVTIIAIALAVGAVRWAFSRPITFAQTAQQLDQLNGTNDLLSTAWFVRTRSDPWGQTLLHQAENRADSLVLPSPWGKYSPRIHLATWSAVLAAGMVYLLAGSVNPRIPTDREDLAVLVNSPSSQAETRIPPRPARVAAPGESIIPESPQASLDSVPTGSEAGSEADRPRTGDQNATGSGRRLAGTQTEWRTRIGQLDPVLARKSMNPEESVAGGRESFSSLESQTGSATRAGVSDPTGKSAAKLWEGSPGTGGPSETSSDGWVYPPDLPQDRRVLLRRYFDR